MKRIILILIFLINSIVILAQERINKEQPVIIEKSVKIENASGWMLTKAGEWVENKNLIHDAKCPDYWISHISNNFKWLQLLKIKYNENIYYALTRESFSGVYKYPTIKEEWIEELRTYYVLFTEKEYLKFHKDFCKGTNKALRLISFSENNINNRYESLGGDYAYNEEILLKNIGTSIDKMAKSKSKSKFGLSFTIHNNNIRFTTTSDYKTPEEVLEKGYFELPVDEFKSLLINP